MTGFATIERATGGIGILVTLGSTALDAPCFVHP